MIRIFILTAIFLVVVPFQASAKILNVQELNTESGIKFWLVEDHTLPVLALNFAVKSGAAKDDLAQQGVTQLLSNTMDEGAGPYDSKAFQNALQDYAIDLSFMASRDYFGGQLRTLNRHRDKALELLTYALNEAHFDNESVIRMKNANIMRIKGSLSKPDWIGARILNNEMFPGHPYALNSGGTLKTMENLTSADLKKTKAKHFSKDRLYIGMVGDVKPDEARSIVERVFGTLPNLDKDKDIAQSAFPQASKPKYYPMNIPQTYLSMAWDGVGINDPDYYAFTVMNHILGGGGFSSILMEEVREKRGLTYGIYSSRYHLDRAQRLLLNASMLPENVSTSLSLISEITKKMMDAPLEKDVLEAAKDYLTGSLPIGLSSTSKIANMLLDLQLDGRPMDALDTYSSKIKAVTLKDVQRVAKRIFEKDPIIVLVGEKPSDVDVDTVGVIPNVEGVTQ